MPRSNLVGERFASVVVLKRAGVDDYHHVLYLCRDDLGRKRVIRGDSLSSGHTKSCAGAGSPAKHGHSPRGHQSATYRSWHNMRSRCMNSKVSCFMYYGRKGVKVCERWEKFENFLADMGERPEGTTLGRFLDSQNYELSNCAWQTPAEQGLERRMRREAADPKLLQKRLDKIRRTYYKTRYKNRRSLRRAA
jgi:hypothetical protein